jgi:hypothetical protein
MRINGLMRCNKQHARLQRVIQIFSTRTISVWARRFRVPFAIGPKTAGCFQAPNTSLVPVYDRMTFFGNSALRIS